MGSRTALDGLRSGLKIVTVRTDERMVHAGLASCVVCGTVSVTAGACSTFPVDPLIPIRRRFFANDTSLNLASASDNLFLLVLQARRCKVSPTGFEKARPQQQTSPEADGDSIVVCVTDQQEIRQRRVKQLTVLHTLL